MIRPTTATCLKYFAKCIEVLDSLNNLFADWSHINSGYNFTNKNFAILTRELYHNYVPRAIKEFNK